MKHFIIVIMLSLLPLTPVSTFASNNENIELLQSEKKQEVYVTPKGKRYHFIDCRTLARSKKIIPMSINSAKQSGRTACKVCRPALASLENKNNYPSLYGKNTEEKKKLDTLQALSSQNSWEGLCVGVSDGDTITVLNDNKIPVKIRLYGIDTPEKKQAFGTKAKLYTSDLVFQQKVQVQTIDIDRYNREVALISLPDSSLLQANILENGMAWVYTQYCKLELCSQWQELELKAKNQQLGLWQDKNAIPPWQWRKEKRENSKKLKQQKAQISILTLGLNTIFLTQNSYENANQSILIPTKSRRIAKHF